jgi:hypothetical protein
MTRSIALLIGALAGLFPLDVQAQFGMIPRAPSDLVDHLSEAILSKGFRNVGVIPQLVIRNNGQEALQGALGPHSRLLADGIRDGLVANAQGNYRVADAQQMREAFAGKSISDLDDPAKLRAIGQAAGGLDAIVVGSMADAPPSETGLLTNVKCEILGLADQSRTPVADQALIATISGLAYRGESFELRRWDSGTLMLTTWQLDTIPWIDMFRPVEFNPSLAKAAAARILGGRTHPDLDSTCPFHIDVVVDGKPRPLTEINEKVYTPVSYGEKYAIKAENHSPKEAFVAIFVDGLNILGKKPEHPGNCRYWHLDPDSAGQFDGWYTGSSGNYQREEFRVSRAADGEASKQGFTRSLGQITAVFYTVGPPPPPKPRPKRRAQTEDRSDTLSPTQSYVPGNDISTEAGEKIQVQLAEMPRDRPGLILAAISVFYRTPARIEELKQESGAHQ